MSTGRLPRRRQRVVIYDATGHGRAWFQAGLTASWRLGGALYRRYPRALQADHVYGAHSWTDAFAFLATLPADVDIGEVQYWGHGLPGRVMVADDVLDISALTAPDHRLRADLEAVRGRLADDALVWWRTCSAFAGAAGQAFAVAQTRFFGCRVAGHTFVIGPWQSGLHSLSPGATPDWPATEGLAGTQGVPSSPTRPNTITCLHGRVPDGW